jgi:hypothetical protein
MVSSYFHHLVWNDKNKKDPKLVNYYRDRLKFEDYSDIKKNLPQYIDFLFTDKPAKLIFFNHPGGWKSYNEKWLKASESNSNIYSIRYEDMLTNTYDEMIKLLDQQFSCLNVSKGIIQKVVSKYSFENQTKRKPGEENTNSFLRKGVSGDWKNYFNEEAKDIFKRHAGDLLIKLGYEKDLNW